jgi:amino acid transporter
LPGLILMGVGMATRATGKVGAAVADDSAWQVGFALIVLWVATGANIFGLRIWKWLNNIGGAMIYIGGTVVLVACIAVWLRHGSATKPLFDASLSMSRVSLWAQIAFAYTGLELGSLMGAEVHDPKRTIPRAVWISAVAVTGAYIVGTLSLMLVLKPQEINPMSGLVQVASIAGSQVGVPALGAIAAGFLFLGILGKLSTWNGGAARLPFSAGIEGAFPPVFTTVHPRWRTPWVALLVQSVACSVFLVIAQAGETLRNGWQSLMDMDIMITFVPFVYIFLSAWRFGQRWSGAAGLFVTLIAMGFALIPPENARSVLLFEFKVIGGSVLLILLGCAMFASSKAAARR